MRLVLLAVTLAFAFVVSAPPALADEPESCSGLDRCAGELVELVLGPDPGSSCRPMC